MQSMIKSAALAAVACAALATGAFAEGARVADQAETAARQVQTGTCSAMTQLSYKTDDSLNASTSSRNFANIPNTTINFTQSTAGCVAVTFTAEGWAPANRLMVVQARLDNAQTGAPGVVQFVGDDDEDGDARWARAHSFTFVFPNVSAGNHTLAMRYKSWNGGRVDIYKHTTLVQHR